MEITATGNDDRGYLVLKGSRAGVIYLDVVSLFPPTFKDRENGCRPDLAQMLADLHPRFMRFPGGCFIEGAYGDGATNRFEWKKTVGPIEERPGHMNRNWGYKVTDGMGYHEYLQLAEDLGASAMFVVNIGIGHEWKVEDTELDPFIQEALDAIEYANGSATETFYGKMRAANGHPEPFNLKYLEIGNEQEFMLNRDDYMRRYMQFYRAIKTRWPELHLIADSYYFDNVTEPVEMKDEHYYDTPDFFITQYGRYDQQSVSSTRIYVGEYAVTKDCGWWGNMNAAIGEAVFMEGCENNSEAVRMMSYAPIFTHEENCMWRPDMIRFNASMSYGTPSYYVQRMFSNNIGKQNIRWNETGNTPPVNTVKGSVGVGTWATNATFENLSVVASDTSFTVTALNAADWTTKNGRWTLEGNTFKQTSSTATDVTCVLKRQFTTTNVDMRVTATKNSGSEGFLIIFDYKDEQNYTWLNLGGWGNSKHAIEQCKNGTKTTIADKAGSLDTGKAYNIHVVKEGLHVRCYIDDELLFDTNLRGEADRMVYASANIDESESTFFVKLVNPHGRAATVNLSFANGQVLSGIVQVLSATNGTDENTVTNPRNITPRNQSVSVNADGTIAYQVPAFSVNVLRLKVTNVGKPVAEPLPAPRLRYSFDNGKTTDDSGNYEATLMGKATVIQQADGNYVLSTGQQGEGSYLKLPIQAIKDALRDASDYTVSLNLLQRIGNNTDRFSWALDFDNGTQQYFGLINAGGNNNWYCEIKDNNDISTIHSWSCLQIGTWHNITYVQQGDNGYLYVDGQLRRTQKATVSLPAIVGSLRNASIGHSPYSADAIMEHALFDDFQVFDKALSPLQVQSIATAATAMHDDGRYDGIADTQDLANLVKEVKNYYADAGNDALTRAYEYAARALNSGITALLPMRYEALLEAVKTYQEEQLRLARAGQPANLTSLITNSSFTRYNVGWQGADLSAVLTGAGNAAVFAGYTDETAEQFSRAFDVWQLLTDLPAGVYALTADAFYRAGGIETAYAAWRDRNATTEYAQLYLGDVTATLQNLYSSDHYSYSPYQYPDNLAAASDAFNVQHLYGDNRVVFTLKEDGLPLRLGIRKQQTVAADWVAYDHFQLHYLGTEARVAPITGHPDHKMDVYDLSGRKLRSRTASELRSLPKGIYIVGGRKYMN